MTFINTSAPDCKKSANDLPFSFNEAVARPISIENIIKGKILLCDNNCEKSETVKIETIWFGILIESILLTIPNGKFTPSAGGKSMTTPIMNNPAKTPVNTKVANIVITSFNNFVVPPR